VHNSCQSLDCSQFFLTFCDLDNGLARWSMSVGRRHLAAISRSDSSTFVHWPTKSTIYSMSNMIVRSTSCASPKHGMMQSMQTWSVFVVCILTYTGSSIIHDHVYRLNLRQCRPTTAVLRLPPFLQSVCQRSPSALIPPR